MDFNSRHEEPDGILAGRRVARRTSRRHSRDETATIHLPMRHCTPMRHSVDDARNNTSSPFDYSKRRFAPERRKPSTAPFGSRADFFRNGVMP
jgi:hypothetical protein